MKQVTTALLPVSGATADPLAALEALGTVQLAAQVSAGETEEARLSLVELLATMPAAGGRKQGFAAEGELAALRSEVEAALNLARASLLEHGETVQVRGRAP